jgi:hypothetical protein
LRAIVKTPTLVVTFHVELKAHVSREISISSARQLLLCNRPSDERALVERARQTGPKTDRE